MIYTCTLNPAVDYVIRVENFQAGGLNRSDNADLYAGGKGINVSRLLKRLGSNTCAIGFAGGFTGEFIKSELDREGVFHRFTSVNGTTRINVKLKSGTETEINGPAPVISEEDANRLVQVTAELTERDWLHIGGSVPSSLPADYAGTLIETARKKRARVVVDTSGAALKALLPYRPFFIKPNHHELSELFHTEVNTKEEAAGIAKKLVDGGTENVIVSMGGEGAVFVNRDSVYFASPPKGTVKNTVGAGDSMVAAFMAKIDSGLAPHEAFHWAVAAGSATAFSDDLCTKEEVEDVYSRVKVVKVEQEDTQ
ncbi:1-phosphofructokinase [Domibacillus epiphyticus]|uniref:Tagatose-6-phosphate kinase n=1 Tax=Domibacillus epiphyticus TaxID=1714355 RepID=A0A1V2A987_9BACI|nr:1-phosphofructokinase [Domibacillus epiphyticus]OMP67561.1 1-phosphofructokinase [Domibacillus epiphyticus]